MDKAEKRLVKELRKKPPSGFLMGMRWGTACLLDGLSACLLVPSFASLFGKKPPRFDWLIFPVEWRRRKALYNYLQNCRIESPAISYIENSIFCTWKLPGGCILTYRKTVLEKTTDSIVYVNDGHSNECLLSSFHIAGTVDERRYNWIKICLEWVIYRTDPPDHPNCQCILILNDIIK